jgi:molybdate transport system substrate-binding protein
MRFARPLATAAASLALAGSLTACNGSSSGKTELHVLAASSLTTIFTDFQTKFEAAHPDVDVQLDFGSSTDLAQQAADGAPGDVLATADQDSMTIAQKGGVTTTTPKNFATNVLVLVTAPGNPDHITSLADLSGKTWVRCDPTAPCGKVADTVLSAQHVTAKPASLEPDARSTLEQVTSGNADAGLVYASDAKSAGSSVTTVPIPGADKAKAVYYIAALKQTGDATAAQQWINLVDSAQGQAEFAADGFGKP